VVTGFATSIASWVLASTLNTDQLGYDAQRAAASLEVGDRPARILFLKNVAIALILIPLIFAVSIVLRLVIAGSHDSIPVALVRDLAVITTWLGYGSLLSVLLPFHPIGWRRRLALRSSWPRFALCVAAPYAVFLGLAGLWHRPAVAVARSSFGDVDHHRWGYALVALGWGMLTWVLGLLLAEVIGSWRSAQIVRRLRTEA
jgi:hypothetical protein